MCGREKKRGVSLVISLLRTTFDDFTAFWLFVVVCIPRVAALEWLLNAW